MKQVVVAVDGSPAAQAAVTWAAQEAVMRKAALRLVHASLWERYETGTEHDANDPLVQARDAARRTLTDHADGARRAHPGLHVTTEILAQETVPALLEAGRDAGLLVMGARGLGAMKGLMLGSVSQRVAAHAPFAVVIVPEGASGSAAGRVVLGLGAHQPPGAAGEFAAAEAAIRSAELDVVHAWEPDWEVVGLSVVDDSSSAQHRAEVLVAAVTCGLELEQTAHGVKVHGQAVPGPAASALAQAGTDAGLLVLGVRRRHGGLGRVAHAVLHRATCPVAVVPLTDANAG